MPDRRTILVVDDDALVRDLLFPLLHNAGFEVVEARSAEQALRALARHRPSMVLVDIGLPGMDGFALTEHIRSDPETSAIPIVYISSRDPETLVLRGSQAGADYFVTKPFDSQDLVVDIYTYFHQVVHPGEWHGAFRAFMPIPQPVAAAPIDENGMYSRPLHAVLPNPPEVEADAPVDLPLLMTSPYTQNQPLPDASQLGSEIHRSDVETLLQGIKEIRSGLNRLQLLLLNIEDRLR